MRFKKVARVACGCLSSSCRRRPPARQSCPSGIGDTGLDVPPGGAGGTRPLVNPAQGVRSPADTLGLWGYRGPREGWNPKPKLNKA